MMLLKRNRDGGPRLWRDLEGVLGQSGTIHVLVVDAECTGFVERDQ